MTWKVLEVVPQWSCAVQQQPMVVLTSQQGALDGRELLQSLGGRAALWPVQQRKPVRGCWCPGAGSPPFGAGSR